MPKKTEIFRQQRKLFLHIPKLTGFRLKFYPKSSDFRHGEKKILYIPNRGCGEEKIGIYGAENSMTDKITTLIIDMYGVILKERTGSFIPYTFEHFEKSRHEELRKKFDEERLFTKAGYGELSSHEFLSLLGYQDTEYHMKNYIENYLSIDEAFIGFAEKYYRKYDFVLLSTDVSEWSAYITQYYGLNKYFKYKIVSGDVHCRKPDIKIYEITLQRIHKHAGECLFIDDSVNNIVSAKELGIKSILFNRYNEQYRGEKVTSFEELDEMLKDI